jgi:hypothetical protein
MMWCANELDGVELACGFPEITVFCFLSHTACTYYFSKENDEYVGAIHIHPAM